ncbi:hypothetical protein IRJ41_012813 [Triplophysa rosa]|uniref:Uncharacterized protein n=1 Tax=Triplophysa rosa TaxID=992332 RepID=A0A9W7X5X8_TRIRA|nr:hypothetical protein IRJ41_012813 [Triplophysa rosa]
MTAEHAQFTMQAKCYESCLRETFPSAYELLQYRDEWTWLAVSGRQVDRWCHGHCSLSIEQ